MQNRNLKIQTLTNFIQVNNFKHVLRREERFYQKIEEDRNFINELNTKQWNEKKLKDAKFWDDLRNAVQQSESHKKHLQEKELKNEQFKNRNKWTLQVSQKK